jgi:hypothetical protein
VLDIDVADTMEDMNASLVYLLARQILQMLTQLARDDGAKDMEILVLRHRAPRGAMNRVGVKDRHRRPVAAGR